jgi:phosphatidylglycerophosphate synthase
MTSSSRRPLKSRSAGWARGLAASLAKSGISPNQISVASSLFAALAGWAFYCAPSDPALLFAAIGCMQLRLVCNLMDGMVAVEHGKKSPVGDLYNEVPDRFADAFILIGAGALVRELPWGLELGLIAAVLAVFTAYVRVLGASVTGQHQFIGPMAKQQRMALLTLAAFVTFFELQYRGTVNSAWYALILMNLGMIITIQRRLARIATDCRSRSSRPSI